MAQNKFVIGLDFGTDSVRSIIVDAGNGEEIGTHVAYYTRWGEEKYSDPLKNQFRHHPLDYMESLEEAIKGALSKVPLKTAENIIGIGIDTTGSTPAPVDREGTILSLKDDFKDNPNAMFVLWKDHTAVEEAERVNKVAKSWGGIDYTIYSGGVYSSEWFFSKILHILKSDKDIRDAAYSWIELADWIPAILTGNTRPEDVRRSRCAAGHKAMWNASWGGLPSEEFLKAVDPLLGGLRDRLYKDTYTSDIPAGSLTSYWSKRLGIPEGIAVTVGAFDPHMGAVGAGITNGTLVKVIGTSCCDMAVASSDEVGESTIAGICGQVDGSVIPGLIGFEAGQSAFGDAYAWFRDVLMWPVDNLIEDSKQKADIEDRLIPELSKKAEEIKPSDTGILALDWLNGRRTPFADQKLKGLIAGLSLGSDAPRIFRALVEATAFGSRAIIERFVEDGVKINEVIAIGGIPQKSPLVMQILADVLNMPVKVVSSFQAVALGASLFAAVASGYYKDIYQAQEKMASGYLITYDPEEENVKTYQRLYGLYKKLGSRVEDILREI
ncbi:MAG: ribulokinase [Actinobacteria bacterium]|nr:ribulokinase [Actinomycetota bacterium]